MVYKYNKSDNFCITLHDRIMWHEIKEQTLSFVLGAIDL